MSLLNRRRWLQKSLLASSALLVGTRASAMAEVIPAEPSTEAAPLRLHANENPYGPSRKAIQAIAQSLATANRYPLTQVGELKERLAGLRGVSSDQILITAGSTEVLSLLGQQVGLQQGEILIPWPSFPTMVRFGEACGARVRRVPLAGDQQIDLEGLLEAIRPSTTLVYICNPNNPTSLELEPDRLRAFCRQVPAGVLICVDEAYIEYARGGEGSSMVSLIGELPNLIVCRTFSKAYGLAGLRIGYALSDVKNITALRSRHTGWELSAGCAPLTGAMATLEDPEFVALCVRRNEEGRKVVCQAFDRWGVQYNTSATNFIYASTDRFGENVAEKLRQDQILISKWESIMDGHMRISIARPQDMQRFVKVIKTYLKE